MTSRLRTPLLFISGQSLFQYKLLAGGFLRASFSSLVIMLTRLLDLY